MPGSCCHIPCPAPPPIDDAKAGCSSNRFQSNKHKSSNTNPAAHLTPHSHPHTSSIDIRTLKIGLRTALFLLIGLLSAYSMSSFIQRLMRPFSSTTMHFAPEQAAQTMTIPEGAQKATLAAGCFWGIEHMYRHDFKDKGLLDARVGYIGGDTENPSYRAVCSGRTGHAEACQIVFDPQKLSYQTILEYFYKMHDPTTTNRQGPDVGSQYRSGVFYHDDEQKSVAEKVTKAANEQWWHGKIITEVLPAGTWWDAEKYHQLYLDNNPGGYECPSHFLRKLPDLKYD